MLLQLGEYDFSVRQEKQHKHKLFGPDLLWTFLTFTPGCPGVKKILPMTGVAEKKNHLLVWTSTIFAAYLHDPKGSRNILQQKMLIFGPLLRVCPSKPGRFTANGFARNRFSQKQFLLFLPVFSPQVPQPTLLRQHLGGAQIQLGLTMTLDLRQLI